QRGGRRPRRRAQGLRDLPRTRRGGRGVAQRGGPVARQSQAPAELTGVPMLNVAIQMDPIERIDINGDSTFALALEAQSRGHALLYYGPRDLTFRDGKVTAHVRSLAVRATKGDHFTLGEVHRYDLSQADVVLMRQDPPFDM